MATSEAKTSDEWKALGNAKFVEKQYDEAITYFTKAIELDGSNHVLYSNRSGAYLGKGENDNALADAEKCIELNNSWVKGYTRKAAALHALQKYSEAIDSYNEALKLDPNNSLAKAGLDSVNKAMNSQGNDMRQQIMQTIVNKLQDPSVMTKLLSNPSINSNSAMMAKLAEIQQNPDIILTQMDNPNVQTIMMNLLTADLDQSAFGAAGAENDPGSDNAASSKENTGKVPEKTQEENMKEDIPDEKKEADELKKKGSELYHQRKFDEAAEMFAAAFEKYNDMTYLTNLATAYFEAGRFEECIKTANEAVEFGRENRADFKLISKSFGRIADAYVKLDNLEEAINHYKKALTECRSREFLDKLRNIERIKIKRDEDSYINIDLAKEAHQKGNKFFSQKDYPSAIKEYTEMSKRDPSSAIAHANLAACFLKLMRREDALKCCDEAIKRDPKYVKAYIRKAEAHLGREEYSHCLDACDAALTADKDEINGQKNNQQILEVESRCMLHAADKLRNESEQQATKRIQSDPEIARVLSDPIMQNILSHAKSNPASLSEFMKDPQVSCNIKKLICAGVIKLG